MKSETIAFLKDGVELGRYPLPERTTEAQRHMIAKENGIESYDQYQFFLNDEKRFDSIDAPGIYDPWGNFISVCSDYHRMMDTNIKLKWNNPHALQDQQG